MPIVQIKHVNNNVIYGLWKIEENVEFLLQHTFLSKYEQAEYEIIQNIKRKKEKINNSFFIQIVKKKLAA